VNAETLLTGGGWTGGVLVIGYFAKLILEGWKERNTAGLADKAASVSERTTAVTDTATANGVVLAALTALGDENGRQLSKIERLETESTAKDGIIQELRTQMIEQAKRYDAALREQAEQIESITRELTELRGENNQKEATDG
jgi:hypothetical protein